MSDSEFIGHKMLNMELRGGRRRGRPMQRVGVTEEGAGTPLK